MLNFHIALRATRFVESGAYPDWLDPRAYVLYAFCHALAAIADHLGWLSR